MDRSSRPLFSSRHALAALVAVLALPVAADASGLTLFQHGARGIGEAGAFTGRANDPSAVGYNPAGITGLDGFQMQAGLDFSVPEDNYTSATNGKNTARHEIMFPPAFYATWRPKDLALPLAFGFGVDSPMWTSSNWDTALFPGRFLARREEVQLLEAHPVVAWQLDEHWSVAGGLRYVYGNLREGNNVLIGHTTMSPLPQGVERLTEVSFREVEIFDNALVSGLGYDAAVQFRSQVWGWGAQMRSAVTASGRGDRNLVVRPDVQPPLPLYSGTLDLSHLSGGQHQSFELPQEARAGLWVAPYPELRLELDASYQAWSKTDNRARFLPVASDGDPGVLEFERDRDRNWKDTVSVRFGAEGDITDAITVFGGVSIEPSPVPAGTLDPSFPRGDGLVFGAGASYNFPQISFDMAYSIHTLAGRNASGQELNVTSTEGLFSPTTGRYSSRDQVFGFSVRWRFARKKA